MYEFTERAGDLTELICNSFPQSMFLPSSDDDMVELFSNGDRMTISLSQRTMIFDGVSPTSMFSSRLNTKRHKWLVDGFIRATEV